MDFAFLPTFRSRTTKKTRVDLIWTPPASAFEGGRGSTVTFVATVIQNYNDANGIAKWWENVESLVVDLD